MLTMFLCTKRHVICLTLIFPALVYLFLMSAAIGKVCFKPCSDQLNSKEEYLKSLDFFQRRSDFLTAADSLVNNRNGKDVRSLLHAGDRKIPSSSKNTVSSNCDISNKARVSNKPRSTLLYNCSSISVMKIKSKIGHGVSKQAFIADYQGTQVAIKMVTRHIHEVRTCLEQLKRSKLAQRNLPPNAPVYNVKLARSEKEVSAVTDTFNVYRSLGIPHENSPNYIRSDEIHQSTRISAQRLVIPSNERQRCYTFPTARLMKEILLSEQLQHHNLAKLLGYCVRSEESDSTDISEHGVISVYELGSRFVLDNLQILPWQTRLRHATEMADLLTYLQNSPLGSLVVPDFKEGHLVMINGSLKLIDLDDVNNLEPECEIKEGRENLCPYNIRCERALCEGFNAKENLKNMNALIFKRLLFPLTFPQTVMAEIGQLNAELDSLTLTASDLKRKLEEIKTFLVNERTL